jgi:hypothetical protein
MKIKGIAIFCITIFICGLSSCMTVKDLGKKMLRGHIDPAKVDTGLPVITITTKTGKAIVSREEYISVDIEIIDPHNSANNIKTEVDIRGRGNSSWNSLKKPYRLRFPKRQAVFGFVPARSWVLLANYQDPTLILNSTAFELGQRFDFPFTPRYVHIEVIVNGRYDGSYVLTEQIQAGKGRVDIDEGSSFLVEMDAYYDEAPKFLTPILGLPVMIKHPEDLEDYTFVKNEINNLEAALFSDSFPNTRYLDLINVDIVVDYILINELTRNVDIQIPHSVYLYKDGKTESKICLGPLWDFDYGFAYDNVSSYFNDPWGMYHNTQFREGGGQKFFARFFDDPGFRKKYKDRWNEKYDTLAGMELFFDHMAAMLEASQKLNSRIWWWRRVDYKEEIEHMKTWWRKRMEYLNTEINGF